MDATPGGDVRKFDRTKMFIAAITYDDHGLASINAVGEDNICFETDYPPTDTTWPFTKNEVERMTTALTDEQRYKVLRGNAIRMLDLDRI